MVPVAGLLVTLALPQSTHAQAAAEPITTAEPITGIVADTKDVLNEEQVREREEVGRFRRARKEEASRRAEAATRLEADRIRQHALTRLQSSVLSFGQRESYLHHEVVSTQQQLNSVSRDPADYSAAATRSDLEHQLIYLQSELDRATVSRQSAVRQFEKLLLR